MRVLGTLLVATLLLSGGDAAAQAERRIALVIGNAAYRVPGLQLENPVRDAELIAARLSTLGFEVDLVRNATKSTMDESFQRFGARLHAAGRNAVSVVFYAGHGAESDGANYLIPVDARLRTRDELRYQAPPAQFLLDYMARAGNAVNVLILDACRDMPLPDGSRNFGRGGLAAIPETPNVLIAYATAPNTTAPDGSGRNSPFTAALAAALADQPHEPVTLLFEDVQTRVYQQSNGGQRPRFTNSLGIPRWSFAAPKGAQASSARDRHIAAVRALLAPVSLAGDAPTKALQDEFQRSVRDRVFFDFDEATIRPEFQGVLDEMARWLLARPKVRVRIYGNADQQETEPLMLGAQRAKAIRDHLLGAGVQPKQVGSTTFGLEDPPSRSSDEASRALSRMVQTKLISVARD